MRVSIYKSIGAAISLNEKIKNQRYTFCWALNCQYGRKLHYSDIANMMSRIHTAQSKYITEMCNFFFFSCDNQNLGVQFETLLQS
jgi:hypothetical protein